uniref:Uridylate-specific endoribonuclease n=1 Tax=Serinus canaria TaxID=9135 RepID=A0A8C9N0T8_SERCA
MDPSPFHGSPHLSMDPPHLSMDPSPLHGSPSPFHGSPHLSMDPLPFPRIPDPPTDPRAVPSPAVPTEGFSSSSGSISEQELLQLSEQLYGLDHNRARPSDIALNPQHLAGPEETGDKRDRSPQPLYRYVNEELFSKPTYASFIKLLDNYQRATGREEEVTAEELQEQQRFLEEVMNTELMRKLFVFLQGKSECGERGTPRGGNPKQHTPFSGGFKAVFVLAFLPSARSYKLPKFTLCSLVTRHKQSARWGYCRFLLFILCFPGFYVNDLGRKFFQGQTRILFSNFSLALRSPCKTSSTKPQPGGNRGNLPREFPRDRWGRDGEPRWPSASFLEVGIEGTREDSSHSDTGVYCF